jgi:hypothetical protein
VTSCSPVHISAVSEERSCETPANIHQITQHHTPEQSNVCYYEEHRIWVQIHFFLFLRFLELRESELSIIAYANLLLQRQPHTPRMALYWLWDTQKTYLYVTGFARLSVKYFK